MLATSKQVLICCMAIGLGACAGTALETAVDRETAGSEFSKELYAGYVELSQSEHDEGDYIDSDTFADRAIMASNGESVLPEEVSARSIPADRQPVLEASRARLVRALDNGGRDQAPHEAALAQTNFDCWMQEQEENRQPDDIAFCQKNFTNFIQDVEKAIAPPPVAPPVVKAEPQHFTVYFGFDSAELDDHAMASLMSVVAATKGISDARVSVSGHTDTAGPAAYNVGLSRLRAEAAAGQLMDDGIDGGAMRVDAFGQTQPAVETGDGVPNDQNRRVEIVVTEP